MRAERLDFPNGRGQRLAGLLDLPAGPVRSYALFASCFTCGKDVHAAVRIAEGLAERGIAVLRFDFTGLGDSEGDFADTTFSTNVADLVAAADHLRRTRAAPALLIGHSLGGAAMLAAAAKMPEARAVVTIAAPSEPKHIIEQFRDDADTIMRQGEAEVLLAGRPFRIRRAFIEDAERQNLAPYIEELHKALLVMHSPTDQYVGVENASRIFLPAKHPKSFVTLDDADHLLTRRSDAAYVAGVIAAWAERYLASPAEDMEATEGASAGPGVTVAETRQGKFQQLVQAGTHRLLADEPSSVGGLDSGLSPYDLLLAGLGACTAMTVRLYADRKDLPLDRVSVHLTHEKIHAADCEHCETKEGKIDRIDRAITFEGKLDEAQRQRLLEIADKCPVHRTLMSEIEIRTAEHAPAR
jgi:putative redox protein